MLGIHLQGSAAPLPSNRESLPLNSKALRLQYGGEMVQYYSSGFRDAFNSTTAYPIAKLVTDTSTMFELLVLS